MTHFLSSASVCGALALGLFMATPALALPEGEATTTAGFALHGTPKYAAGFTQFDYVNTKAPKGGLVRLGGFGGFDTFNKFTLKGEAADGLEMVYDTLMMPAEDEPSTLYPLLAESITVPAARTWVAFTLNPAAKFSDGKPVTADDVVWTFNTLTTKGAPFYQAYYADVTKVEAEKDKNGHERVVFLFKDGTNRELPLILGGLPVLPRHAFEGKDFTATTLDKPIGSGPYAVETFTAGRSITYARRADYWGKDLPVNKGRYNFGQIRYDYYRDLDVMFEAFKAGQIDFRLENVARNWATAYTFPAVQEGRVVKDAIPNKNPQGMQGFAFNTRKAMFADARVRHAITLLLDFEWMNATLFNGQYTRTGSYFANSELAATGVPTGAELALLEPYRAALPPQLFTEAFTLPVTKGDGNLRPQMKEAMDLLTAAGWAIKGGKLVNTTTGQPLSFEILLVQENFVRVAQPFTQALQRLGITATLRVVDTAQYINRVNDFDFDMIVGTVPASLSPGNEQINFWHSSKADVAGAHNVVGVKSPVVDGLIAKVLAAQTRDELVTAVKALDRVLLWGWYFVPQWHTPFYRTAYWTQLAHPQTLPQYSVGFPDLWWSTEAAH